MSRFCVPITTIKAIRPHPDLDTTSLEIADVYNWEVVVKKGQYQVEDRIIFVMPDSLLTPELEAKIFGPDSKIKLHKGRVRQIRLRKFPSQGLIIPVSLLPDPTLPLETDVAEILGITKYEPEVPDYQQLPKGTKQRNKPLTNPRFHEYNGVDNIKYYRDKLENKEVVVQTKLHGTNARFGMHLTVPNTLWKKFLNFFGLLPTHEYCYGSNKVELTNRVGHKGYYGEDVYGKAFKDCRAQAKVKPGETIYGEIVCEGIQAGYHYGWKTPHFVLFDVKVTLEDGTQKYLDPEYAQRYAQERDFDFVPVIFTGLFDINKIEPLISGRCDYYPLHTKEGVVIKIRNGYHDENFGKQAYKWINPVYLDDKKNTDFH